MFHIILGDIHRNTQIN